MHLHSTLEGRAGAFRVRGAAWELDPRAFRGFLYVIPAGAAGDGRHQVVEADGGDLWELLSILGRQVRSVCGTEVTRLDARAVGARRPAAGRGRPRAPGRLIEDAGAER